MDPVVVVILLLYAAVVVFAILGVQPAEHGVNTPTRFLVEQLRRNSMSDVLVYRVNVAAPTDTDVVERQLRVTLNGDEANTVLRLYSPTVTDLGEIEAPQGAVVELSLVDVDDAGNVSEPAYLNFVATDTLPPAQPGAFRVELVAEKTEADADPDAGA